MSWFTARASRDSRRANFQHDPTTAWFSSHAGGLAAMSDAKAATQDEATTPTEVPPWRAFAKVCVLALMLGAGWIAGAKTPVAELAQVSSTAWAQVVGFGDSLEAALAHMASWAAPRERIASSGVESTPTNASPDGGLDRFAGKLEQIR